jgi:hypothetical protein
MADLTDHLMDMLQVFNIWRRELITTLKVPTPIKITTVVTTLDDGCIGSGVDDPSDPETLWECSMAHEGWIHRIVITSPAHTPASPLTTGQIMLLSSSGHVLTWAPQPGLENNVIPIILEQEGRFSAIHLSPGEKLYAVGDQLPAGIQVRFDLQINLVSGVSADTPIPFVGTSLARSTTNGS